MVYVNKTPYRQRLFSPDVPSDLLQFIEKQQ